MDRSELVKKLDEIDYLIGYIEDKMKENRIELIDDHYFLEDIEDKEIKAQAELYNMLVDVRKKEIANLNKEDLDLINSVSEFINNELRKDKSEEKKADKKVTETKKAEKKETKKEEKVSKETKTETKGTLGEVISCLFGQVDKRFNNLVAKSPKINNFLYKTRMDRYNHPFGYISWRSISLPIAGMALGLASLQPWLIPVGVGLGVFGGQALAKFAVAMVRRATKNQPTKFKPVELTKGTYLENLTNAWNKFKNPKSVNKTNNVKTNVKPVEVKETKKEDSKEKVNAENLIKEFTNAVNGLDLNNLILRRYDYCNSLYEVIKANGLLDRVDKKIVRKFAISTFVANVNKLSEKNSKEALDRCQYLYNSLKDKFGENIFAEIPSEIMNKFNECKKALVNKETNVEVKKEENKEETKKEVEVDKVKLTKLISYVLGFKLEATMQSVDECENLIQQVFHLNEKEKKVFRGNEEAWNKVKYLMNKSKEYCEQYKGIKYNDRVSTFINLVNTFDFKGEEVKYDQNQLMACINIYSRLSDTEKAMIPEKVMRNYNDALRFDQVFTLKTKLSMLDIDKCIKENDYHDIYECCEIYDRYISKNRKGLSLEYGNDLVHKRKLGRDEIKEFPQALKDKLDRAMSERDKVQKYQNAIIGIKNVVVDNRVQSVLRIVSDNEVLDEVIIPWSSAHFNENEISDYIVNRHPYMSNVKFVPYEETEILINDMRENKKGNHR